MEEFSFNKNMLNVTAFINAQLQNDVNFNEAKLDFFFFHVVLHNILEGKKSFTQIVYIQSISLTSKEYL